MSNALRSLKVILPAIFLLVGFAACKSKKKTQQTQNPVVSQPVDTVDDKCKMDFKNGKALSRLMKEKEMDFKTASGKLNCEMTSGEEDNSFNVSVRCRKDSAIWLNISKAAIDAMRVLITKDSVKFMIMTSLGGLEKGFFRGDFTFINTSLNADLDYDVIQALLFGNSADFLNDSVKMKGGKDRSNCQYILSTIRKKRLQRVIEGGIPKESLQAIWLNPQTWKISMLEYDDPETKRKFTACFDDFQPVDNYTMPLHLLYTITAEKLIKAEIKWAKIKRDEEVSFPYKVPSSYPEIQLKKKE
jgi:hypothetical protein